ncbi:MAG: diguanylate cyclase [Marinobacterium sp.]|nr:diguanylate cyclase [Marinobacterium sp.]
MFRGMQNLLLMIAMQLLVMPAAYAVELDAEEYTWLQSRGEIRYCSDSEWMPFEGLDRQGNHIGIGADFIAEFARLLEVSIRRVPSDNWAHAMELAKARQCDFLSLTNPGADRARYFEFTAPYVSLPVVLVGRKGEGYMDGLDALSGESVALLRGSIMISKLQALMPHITIRQYDSLPEALIGVMKGEARAAAAPLSVALYHMQKLGLTQLEISGHTPVQLELGLAVRNDEPQLVGLLRRAVDAVSPADRTRIMQRWYTVELQQARDYTLLLGLICMLLLVLIFLVYRNRMSRRFAQQLEKVNARLSDRNQRLEQVCKRDYLTGVLNRVSLDAELTRSLQRAVQQCQPLSLILLDLDRFSQVNRRYGHQAGDVVLVEICRVLEQEMPDWVRLGRWQGDRFLLICPRTHVREAQSIARKLSLTLQLHQYSEDVHISASICIACCDGHERPAVLMHALERQLRRAKEVGPQQLVVLEEPGQHPGDSREPAA